MEPFGDFDFTSFWEGSEYADREYTDEPPTPELVASVELMVGYRLPAAYVALAKIQNGGRPSRTAHPASSATTWAKDHVAIHGIYSIGSTRPSCLCGALGSQFWESEWGYPSIGAYFADCPSAGHDMLCLD